MYTHLHFVGISFTLSKPIDILGVGSIRIDYYIDSSLYTEKHH